MSKTKKLKLTKIALETKDGKQVELTIDEAKELHGQLDELFGSKTTYLPSAPIYIQRDTWPQPYRPYWLDSPTCTAGVPKMGGVDVQCQISGKSGLTVSYAGTEL